MTTHRPIIKKFLLFFAFIGGILASSAQEVAPFTPRLDDGNIEIRGDIIFVGNNILNRASEADPTEANTPYNGNENNNSLYMEYIDIDGDSSTFSSSSAELNLNDPTCSQVRYAGLYWAATYPNERSTDGSQQFSGTPRIEDWFNIKFKTPGGSYVDLSADTMADPEGEEDDIIYDGYNATNINNSFKDSPYICYKNVTNIVRANSDPNGEYTVANVRATKGRRNGSSSAGWVMVVIYENPNESGKFISTYDGYAGMSSAAGNVDVEVNGFRTLPTPFPVRARIGVGALEGDRGISNARFFLKADTNTNFTNLSTGLNPANNFFNSTITTDGNEVPTRTPFGTNTLGTDLDLFNLNNPSNSVLPNSESGATLRFTSTGDGYGAFLTSFAVEIIEPNIVLEKRVENLAGDDITDGGVNLGQTLDYVLSFRNLGNDDAINYVIRDVLPTNTSYISFDVDGAPGVTANYDAATNEVDFSIPNDLVEIGDPTYTIRLRVEVAENCFDFVDACSNQIQNVAFSTYQGDLNRAVISDDPSVSDFDNCGFETPGATNFLLDDLAACNFTRTVELCGADAILNAGKGFDSYIWYKDTNNNGVIDSSDPVQNDGDADNDASTLLVTDVGVYIVDKIIPDPCKGFQEIITVERFGSTQTNPIVDYYNEVNNDTDPTNDIQGEIVTCSVDGDLLPKIFLCGTNDSQLMQVNIIDAQSLVWEKLDETSCTAAADDCANKNLGCSWSQVETGNSYEADTAGKYRLVINYTNGCFSRFYFDVFQNELEILFNSRDIICDRDGRIQVTNLGSGYGYQLIDHDNNTIIIPFSAGNGPTFNFDSGENGSYRVEVVQLDSSGAPITGACIFSTDPIGIRDRDFQVDITTTPANCNEQATIKVDVLNVRADYTYRLLRSDGTLIDDETAQSDNTHTFSVNAGDYIVETSTADGCADSQNITVTRIPDPTLSAVTTANIGCTAGTIELTRTGGQGNPDFLYAIWSKDGTDLYPSVTSIPADAYQVESTFALGWRDEDGDGDDDYVPGEDGTYEFVIIDANNCFAFSNPVTINDNGSATIDSIDETQPTCSGENDGALTINVSGGIPPYQYSIDNGANYQATPNFVDLSAATYPVRVLDASGCDVSQSYNLAEPFPLSASAGVSRDATCDPNGAEVRITNVIGGNGTYQYSFDGGASFSGSTVAVLPPGDYTIVVTDGLCEFPIAITVDDIPEEPEVTLTPEVSYLCDGSAVVTATPNITTYDYTYYLDGVINSPPTSNAFSNVSPGTYIVSTNYISQTPPVPSILLTENFGYGDGTIQSADTSGYFYEAQTTGANPNQRPGDKDTRINDYEYAVTNRIINPYTAWISPNDHTSPSDPTGRFLVMNVGTPSAGQIIYSKAINDVIPNQPIRISLQIFNLLISANTQLDPDLTIEIREPGTGTVVQSIRTGDIPKHTGPDDWIEFTADLDPGANTTLDFVIRTEKVGNSGNDFALDDIEIFQVPEVCELTVETPVTVEAARTFQANITATSNVSCNGENDATITFEVENFDVTTGFDYSLDGGTNWINSMSSPVTITGPIGVGTQRIDVRKANETSCTTFVEQTISQPDALVADGSVTTTYTCANGGATITATVSGGTPNYQYQLEDDTATVITGYDFMTNGNNRVFSNIAVSGDYVVRIRDANTCEDTSAPITVSGPETIVFDLTPTNCYSGTNDGEILVNVTAGNGGYQFRIDGGPWRNPATATPEQYTFTGLTDGTYTIEVQDQLGCPVGSNAQVETISPQLVVAIDIVDLTACNDGSITISASGGNGTLQYAFVPANTSPDTLFGATNTFTITEAMATANPSGYDVYVQDNNSSPVICSFIEEDIIFTPVAPLMATAAATDPECYNGLGSIDATAAGGTAPFDYTLTDLSPADGIDYGRSNANISSNTLTFNGIGAGDYEVTITDSKGCTVTSSAVTINNATEITADIDPILPATCNDPDVNEYGFGFTNVITPTSGGSELIEYSADGGSTWQISNELRGYASGTEVFPSIRVTLDSGTICQRDFDRYIIPFPLDNLDINVSAVVVDCNDLQVRVQGTAGVAPYEYAFSDDPANFDPATATWQPGGTIASDGSTVPAGNGRYVWTGLIPGRTYVFYVRDDSGCVRQSLINVNDIITEPLEITYTETPTCFGAISGSVEFTLNPVTPHPEMRWEIYELGNSTPIIVSGGGTAATEVPYNNTIATGPILGEGDYYIEVVQVDSSGNDACIGGSENAYIYELAPLSANALATRDISCNLPGLITVENISGGGGAPYTFDVTGPSGFTALIGTNDNPVQIPVNSPAGNYTVTLHDQYGCSITLNDVTLQLTPNPTITVEQDNCSAPVTVTATGTSAVGNLRYRLVSAGDPVPAPTSYLANNGIFENVTPGVYDVYVIDGNGCSNLEAAFVVHPVLSATASQTKLLDCSATPEAQITIEVTDGSGNYDYQITNGSGSIVARSPLTSNPFVYSTTQPEDYVITVYDNATSTPECSRIFAITVDPAIIPEFTETHQDISCNGSDDGTITLTETTNGVNPLTYSISPMAGTFNAATSRFENLPPNTYTVTGMGTNGCAFDITNIFIDTPNAIVVPAAMVTEFGCTTGNNSNNAVITIDETAVTGGSGNYLRYEFINTTTGSTVQSGANSSYTETDLAGGIYSITVYDSNGCIGNTTASILPFVAISDPVVTTTQEAACSPMNNAEIEVGVTVSPSSATPNLEYVVEGIGSTTFPAQTISSTNNPENFIGLEFGTYSVSITNVDTGCIINTVHKIDNPDIIQAVITKLSDEECLNDGVDGGSFQLEVFDYSGNYSYQVYDNADNIVPGANFNGTGNTGTPLAPITGLAGGVYYVRVIATDAPACEDNSNSITINAPSSPITATIREEANVSCSNDQGKILVDPTGGKGPYDINLNNTTTGQSYTATNVSATIFENLSAGVYDITVTDDFNCVFLDNITLIRPDDIIPTLTQTPLNCFNGNTASITTTVGSRTNPTAANYEYQLMSYGNSPSNTPQASAFQSNPTFSGLAAGYYSVLVRDTINCSTDSTILEILNPTEVVATLNRTSPLTCTTGVELELFASGGASGSYEYRRTGSTAWVSMPASNSVDLPTTGVFNADEYQYEVRDAVHGCAAVLTDIITEDPIDPVILTVDESAAVINCNGDNTAIIYATATGGLGNYEYSLYTDSSLDAASLVAGPLNVGEFGGLTMGIYYVNVTSGNDSSRDCTAPAQEVIITEPDVISVVDPNDFNNVTCNGANDGAISVELTGGTAPYQYAISPNLNQFSDENVFTDLEGSPTGIEYTVIAQDSRGCFLILEYTIIEPNELEISTNIMPEVCQGESNGSVELIITGGTAPYSTRLNSETNFVQDRTLLSDLAAGDYIVFIRDAAGCDENVLVTVEPGVNLNATVETVYGCEDNMPSNYINIVLEDATVADEVLYALDSTDPADMQLNPFFRDTLPGLHYIAISHANGCMVIHNFETESYDPLTINVTQSNINELTATVNGGRGDYTLYFGDVNNGEDNTFMIDRTDTYVVTVVDESGCEAMANIFIEFIDIEIPNFFTPNGDAENQSWKPRNDEGFPEILTIIFDRYGREVYRIGQGDDGWDGFYQQTELPTGDYWYIIKLNGENDDREFVGHFTLYR